VARAIGKRPRGGRAARAGRSARATVGIIGGSGLYAMDGLGDVRRVAVTTPFGRPSDRIVLGRLGDVDVAFLPRHGEGHRLSPSELPFRANIYALKMLGVEAVIAVSAVGSLRAEIAPGHLVIPDQFIDRTRNRVSTFFGNGVVAHVGFADPICPRVARALAEAAASAGARVHPVGTYVCMEGPQFSTRAESELYRSWGGHVIGMTNLQEAKLAREAELCFATVAMVTDYDCWKTTAEAVDVQEILRVLEANVLLAKRIIAAGVPRLRGERACGCASALRDAIITNRASIPAATRRRLALLAGRYMV
jgi:5'-methylthioadenosine phosphorylase